jgi:hypothetical protein
MRWLNLILPLTASLHSMTDFHLPSMTDMVASMAQSMR